MIEYQGQSDSIYSTLLRRDVEMYGEWSSGSNSAGLLDIAVELSSDELYAGTEFTVYVLVKNPFGRPLWIQNVTVSIPSQMYWRTELSDEPERTIEERVAALRGNADPELLDRIAERCTRIQHLRESITVLEAEMREAPPERVDELTEEQEAKKKSLAEEQNKLIVDEQLLYGQLGYNFVFARGQKAFVDHVEMKTPRPIYVSAEDGGKVTRLIHRRSLPKADTQRDNIHLESSLPLGEALQPGSTGVWQVRLATKSNMLFLPAQYRLQFNVVYSFDPPLREMEAPAVRRTLRVDTRAQMLSIRASMQAVMVGALLGGLGGALAREAQTQVNLGQIGRIIPRVILSCILSVAAVMFATRKSETQAFICVEDFWGGALIGFLIGFAGTAAFGGITGA
jgi:hypothetical protein